MYPENKILKLLIADDHEIVRKRLKQIILEGFPLAEVEEAVDAPELLNKVFQGKWDIVITDLAMPGGGGLEALNKIRQHFPELPVLILSLYTEEQYARHALNAGAAGYLTKDAAIGELVNVVECIVSKKKYLP